MNVLTIPCVLTLIVVAASLLALWAGLAKGAPR